MQAISSRVWTRVAVSISYDSHHHITNVYIYTYIYVCVCVCLCVYLTKMGINTVPHPPYSRDLAPCDFWLFPKLKGCRYETIEEMKEAATKVLDTLIQEDFHGAFQMLLESYNKGIAAGGDYFEGD